MAKIRLGILGGISGKVASVVGGKWKGKSYIRSHVTPANPNTTGQIAARDNMKAAMEFAKANNEAILKPNYVNVVKGKALSAINRFIKNAVTGRVVLDDYENTPWSEGNVTPVSITKAEYDTAQKKLFLEFLPNLTGYASATDKLQIFVGSKGVKMADIFQGYDGTIVRGTNPHVGTGMYRILSRGNDVEAGDDKYVFIVAKASNGDVSVCSKRKLVYPLV